MRERPALSVVVPTLGRPRLLDQCLAALSAVRWAQGELEIVIVDDGPGITTRAAVVSWTERFLLRGVVLRYEPSTGPHGPAAARNRGWRAARGSIIAFTDDDTQPAPDWLEQGARVLASGADAAWGTIVMPIPPVRTDYALHASGLERAGFVTANCFCRRAILERLGGFDEKFLLAWREDTDFYFRLLDSGARVVHAPGAVVLHPARPAPWGVSIKQQRKVLFDALLYKKHPSLYRRHIRARPRWDHYLVVLSLLAMLVASASGPQWLFMAAGILWTALTGILCAKRLVRTSKAPGHVAEMLLTSMLIPPLAVFWRLYGAVKFRTLFL